MSKAELQLGDNGIENVFVRDIKKQRTDSQLSNQVKNPKQMVEIQVDNQGRLYIIRNGEIFACHGEDPIESARQFARGKKGIMFLFGVGLGFEWMSLLEHREEESFVVAMEPGGSFLLLSNSPLWDIVVETEKEYADFTKIIKGNELETTDFHPFIPWQKIEYVHIYHTPGYDKAFPHEYKAFLEKIKNEMQMKIVDQQTFLYSLDKWKQNFLNNIPFLTKSLNYQHFYDIFKIPIPGIVVSAGPSLDKNIHLLQQMEDKGFIICGYTAWKALRKAGIQPDLLIAIDAQQLSVESAAMTLDLPLGFNLQVDSELLYKATTKKERPLAGGAETTKGVSEETKKDDTKETKTIYMPNFLDPMASFLGIEPLESGGSVACVITSFLKYIGCDPIIFVGQDLALDGKKSHASHTDYDKKPLQVPEANKIKIAGIDKPVWSTQSLYSFLLWFEKYIALHPEIDFIDATAGGAQIKKTTNESLESLVNRLPNIRAIKNKFRDKLEMEAFVLSKEALENIRQEGIEELETYIPLWAEGLEILNKIEENVGNLPMQLSRLDEIDASYTQWKMARLFLHLPLQRTQFTMLQAFMKEDNVLFENRILYRDLMEQGQWVLEQLKDMAIT